jgi:hypothetical protein
MRKVDRIGAGESLVYSPNGRPAEARVRGRMVLSEDSAKR